MDDKEHAYLRLKALEQAVIAFEHTSYEPTTHNILNIAEMFEIWLTRSTKGE